MASTAARHRIRRAPKKARYDRATIDAALDGGLVAHVGIVEDGQPYCLPMLHARVGERVYIHGSTKSRLLRRLAEGAPACLTVTVVHGLVLARSIFKHSANFDSVMLLGRFEPVAADAERLEALEAFSDKLLPGRWAEVRPPDAQELAATAILAMPIAEAAVKTRSGPPDDGDSPDGARDCWAGELPIERAFGAPLPAPDLRDGIELSASVRRLVEPPAADTTPT